MPRRPLPLYWRVFAVNAGLLTAIAFVLIVTPVTISTPILVTEAVLVGLGLLVTVAVKRQFATSLPKLTPEAELAIYRVAQESLTNIARHAQASRVVVCLEPGRESVVLRVADDGRGLAGAPRERGGLRGMRERAVLVGGALAVKQAPEGGVEVRLEVPARQLAPTAAVR